jgi:hypothetical protein
MALDFPGRLIDLGDRQHRHRSFNDRNSRLSGFSVDIELRPNGSDLTAGCIDNERSGRIMRNQLYAWRVSVFGTNLTNPLSGSDFARYSTKLIYG